MKSIRSLDSLSCGWSEAKQGEPNIAILFLTPSLYPTFATPGRGASETQYWASMARRRDVDVDVEERIPPRFNFDPTVLIPSLASRSSSSSQGLAAVPTKLNTIITSNLDVLSPQARAVNASQHTKDKGKGRARAPEIIELSDSDSDDADANKNALRVTVHTANKTRQASTSLTSGSQLFPVTATASTVNAIRTSPNVASEMSQIASQGTERVEMDNVPPAVNEPPLAELPFVNPVDNLVSSVLEIVPNVEPDHIVARYTQLSAENQESVLDENPIIFLERILHDLFENPDYPKSKENDKKRKRQEEGVPAAGPSVPKKRKSEAILKVDLLAPDRPYHFSPAYRDLALVCRVALVTHAQTSQCFSIGSVSRFPASEKIILSDATTPIDFMHRRSCKFEPVKTQLPYLITARRSLPPVLLQMVHRGKTQNLIGNINGPSTGSPANRERFPTLSRVDRSNKTYQTLWLSPPAKRRR